MASCSGLRPGTLVARRNNDEHEPVGRLQPMRARGGRRRGSNTGLGGNVLSPACGAA